jgi:adenylate cyclase
MPGASTSVAILFADIEGSTSVYDALGDVRARAIMAQCLDRIIQAIRRGGGNVVKTIGDEVMSTFPTADQATEAARNIQRSILEHQREEGLNFGVHVGIHFGPVLEEEGDVYGDVVNVAARMVSLAKAGQILTTRETVEALKAAERQTTRRIDRLQLKGKQEEIDVFEVIWETADLTTVVEVASMLEHPTQIHLVVSLGNQVMELGTERAKITIGRGPDNDLVLDDPLASRRHAHLELRQGKFLLIDNSTNGTFVSTAEGEPIYVHREEMMLPEAGNIGIGPGREKGTVGPVRFVIERG